MEKGKRDLEYWENERKKILDPVSGEYYFYSNYFRLQLPDGTYTDPPKLTEEEFNNKLNRNKDGGTIGKQRVGYSYKRNRLQ